MALALSENSAKWSICKYLMLKGKFVHSPRRSNRISGFLRCCRRFGYGIVVRLRSQLRRGLIFPFLLEKFNTEIEVGCHYFFDSPKTPMSIFIKSLASTTWILNTPWKVNGKVNLSFFSEMFIWERTKEREWVKFSHLTLTLSLFNS